MPERTERNECDTKLFSGIDQAASLVQSFERGVFSLYSIDLSN